MMFNIPIQPTKRITIKRVDDGWLVWMNGNANTKHSTYLYLYDTGEMHRVIESPDSIDITKINAATTMEK